MTSISARFPTYDWNSETIKSNGITFLTETSNSIKTLKAQWDASQKSGFYSNESKLAAKKVKVYALQARQEMRRLERAVCINAKNGDDKTRLNQIRAASQAGREFLTGFIEKTQFPTDFNHTCNDWLPIGDKALGLAIVGAAVGMGVNYYQAAQSKFGIRGFDADQSLVMERAVAVAVLVPITLIAANIFGAAKARFFDAPRTHKVEMLQKNFENALKPA